MRKPVTGDEKEFNNALTAPKVGLCSTEDLKTILRLVMVKIGLREANWPADEEKAVIISHVKQSFSGLTISEIRLAFDLAIAEKIVVEVNCFENFSCLYLSRILNAYTRWSTEMYRQLSTQRPKEISGPKEISHPEYIEWAKELKVNIEKNKWNWQWMPATIYDWLTREKIIKIAGPKKQEYLAQAVVFRFQKLSELKDNGPADLTAFECFRKMKEVNCIEGSEIDKVKAIARKLILFDFITQNDLDEVFK